MSNNDNEEPGMSEKLDNLIGAIGGLVADMKHVREKTDAIDNKVQHLNDKNIMVEMKVEAANKRLDVLEPIVNNHQAILEQGKGARRVIAWAWGTVTAVGAFIVGLVVDKYF